MHLIKRHVGIHRLFALQPISAFGSTDGTESWNLVGVEHRGTWEAIVRTLCGIVRVVPVHLF